MFQPETEDMLPRMAPKPSAAAPLEEDVGIVRPQVPEVSILFGQQEVNVKQQHLPSTNDAKPTYETWKKQMLPKVTFPPCIVSGTEVEKEDINFRDHNVSKKNIYPFRSGASNSPSITRSVNVGGIGGATVNNPITCRHSLEGCNKQINYPQLSSQQPLPQIFSPSLTSRDVLTICAGTQTDKVLEASNFGNIPWPNVATKEDVETIRQMLEEINQEQHRISKILEVLIFNYSIQMMPKPQTCDVGVQTESIENDHLPNAQDDSELQNVSKNKFVQHLKLPNKALQTPKGKPIAQSTTYQPDSPQLLGLQENIRELSPAPNNQQSGSKPDFLVAKPASDTSLAMNELALKYLPSEKLADLLKELNMECPLETNSAVPPNISITPPKLNENKFEKGPSDISNASYKYLKKYRLLSETRENNCNTNEALENKNHMHQYNLPQYSERNTPANQRQTPTNKNLPYACRLPLSPLARVSPPLIDIPPHIVNLENIKQQPKFL